MNKRVRMACWIGAIMAAALAALLPVSAILNHLAARFHTVADFREQFMQSLQMLRVALAMNAAVLAISPWAYDRCRFLEPHARSQPTVIEWGPVATLALSTLLLAAPGMSGCFQQDEYRVLTEFINHGPLVILTRSETDNHILYSLMAWPFVRILGPTEVAVRIPAFLLSLPAAPMLYLILRRHYPKLGSFLASLPLAGSPFLISYAHEGRAYGPLASCVLALAWLHAKTLEAGFRTWIAYVIVATLTVYLHIFASMAVVGLAIAACFLPKAERAARLPKSVFAVVVVGALSFLLYAPVLPELALVARGKLEGLEPPYPAGLLLSSGFVGSVASLWALPFGISVLFGLWRRDGGVTNFAGFLATAGLSFLACAISGTPQASRYYGPALMLCWILIGCALASSLRRGALGAWLLISVLAATIVADVHYFRLGKRDFRAAAKELRARMGQGEILVLMHDTRPIGAYLDGPIAVLDEPSVRKMRPDWFAIVDVNLDRLPRLKKLAEEDYTLEFRLPSVGGEVQGYHLRRVSEPPVDR